MMQSSDQEFEPDLDLLELQDQNETIREDNAFLKDKNRELEEKILALEREMNYLNSRERAKLGHQPLPEVECGLMEDMGADMLFAPWEEMDLELLLSDPQLKNGIELSLGQECPEGPLQFDNGSIPFQDESLSEDHMELDESAPPEVRKRF
ncbi:hypothetical protein FHG87_001312 [Trinorchestia longiramus]|nr:hypothetical protein FHG87_001312 [Trinorchestia longiramus]